MRDGLAASGAAAWLWRYVAPGSPYRGVIMAVGALVALILIRRLLRRRLERYIRSQMHREDNARAFLRGYDAAWKVLIAILVIVAAAGSFALLGLSVAFLGTMLGWSLQAPIRGLAAWVMVVLKKPFRVGDRITVAGVTGDVTDIQLNHIILNQVGGTVEGEERSGRGVLVPNAMLFGEKIINYDLFSHDESSPQARRPKFMLDEVLVRVSFGTDFDSARALGIEAAKQAVDELIGPVDEEPYTRTGFVPYGVLIRVRYKTRPSKRQEVSSRVTELIWKAFSRNPDKVRFRFPTSVAGIVSGPGDAPPPMPETGPAR